MATTKANTGNQRHNGKPSETAKDAENEVLTLSEAAAYLRVPEEDLVRMADLRELPGRQIGKEWRFLKAGLQHWLRTPERRSGNDALLALAGAWKEDPDVEEIVRQAHRRRGRRQRGE